MGINNRATSFENRACEAAGMSASGTFQTSRDVRVESVVRTIADIRLLGATQGKRSNLWRSAKSAQLSIETERWKKHMTRILFVGQKPETVDFSDPALPPGFDAEKINAGIAIAVAKIGDRGWQRDTCMITPDEAGREMLEKTLKGAAYDCVVIGGGLRIPPKSLALFEMVVNAVHKAAPGAKIAFNTRPEDTAEAAARQLNAG